MKKTLLFLIVFLFCAIGSMAQTETAVKLYKEATSDKSKLSQFFKQDFSAIDSTSMHDLAVLFYRDKDYASAGECWEIALSKVKKYGKAYEKIANALTAVYSMIDNPDKTLWLMGVLEDYNQHELTLECNDYKCKLERAQYYAVKGDEVTAKRYIVESINLCKTETERIEVEEVYAEILFNVKDYESSAQYYFSAAKRWEKLGDNSTHVGKNMFSASQNYLIARNFDISENCANEAVTCFKQQRTDEEKKYYLKSLSILGTALFCQQKYAEALNAYQNASSGYKSLMPSTESYADALENVAKTEVHLKQFDEAKVHYQEALDIYKSKKLDSKYSNTYSSYMNCLRKSGNSDEADKMEADANNSRKVVYQRLLDNELSSLNVTQKFLGSEIYTNSLNTIASCYFGLDQYENSAKYYNDYTDQLREMLRDKFLYMTEEDRQRVWKEQQNNIDEFGFNLSVLPDSSSQYMQMFIPTFYNLELISKGIMLTSSIEFEKVLNSLKDKTLINVYQQIKDNLNLINELQNESSDDNLKRILELKQQNIPLKKKLMEGCASADDYTKYLGYTWQDVQNNLNENDVAIEFTSVQMSPLDKDIYLLALVLSSTGKPVMEVVTTKAILKNMESIDDIYDDSKYYGLFWGFLNKHLVGKKRIFFAPNNLLSNIAIEYFRDQDIPLCEKYEVYRLSSTKELCRDYQTTSNKQICLFGNIDYETANVSKTKGALSFGQLKHSQEEIHGIEHEVKSKYKIRIYEGKDASEVNFMKLSENSPSILHISSHGAYYGDNKTSIIDAMKQSMLAFSGVNRTGQPTDNDGFVTAADVASMNLRTCDLAVLSACQTGVGALGDDGVFGLQRGFKNAGVHTLMMSLKPVEDESTTKLMIYFYQGLMNGKSKREALIEAQKQLRQTYSEGKYWAPFILLDAFDK